MGLWERPAGSRDRPRVVMNFVSTVDGRATLRGRSGPLSDSADRALFHALRACADGVLVGAGTLRTERYGRLIRNEQVRRLRRRRGLEPEPLACIVSGRLALDEQLPLLGEQGAHVVILTASAASLPAGAAQAQLEYVRCARDGTLELARCLAELRTRFQVQLLLCEGGPHLAGALLAAGLVDELFLSLSPLLAGGEPRGEEALRILAGAQLDEPTALELRAVLRHGSTVFLRYAVLSVERVARETTPSSSEAS